LDTTIVLRKAPELRTLLALSELSKLMTTKEGNMSDFSKYMRDELAQEMGWTPRRAQGYVDGETYQRIGQDMPGCHKDDLDEYSKGFRTGYYTQACSLSISNIRETLTAL
jgi:hypothetical protein